MKLTVVMTDSFKHDMGLKHENEYYPLNFRTVQIELTEEQISQLIPKITGYDICNGERTEYYESIHNSWLEE